MRAIGNLVLSALMLLAALAPALAQDGEDVAVINSGDQSFTFTVEIADTPEETARGLMFREELAPDAGMLFDFVEERPASFWMQNTLISLDMLFIKADGEIVRIHENAVPMDTTPIPSGEPIRFVLEIPGGRSAELGLEAGARLEHPRVQAEVQPQ
ncbi:DUF192 domain-containing protein [Pelagibacterium halotolerans]|uniref:Exported protein n=1 Tax=Pelagibacterium halotolerans (strain DSM 22347 / JCM 15775 / CGMCC 1.7692 / B2) TaxID=1082931 RepID=G4R6L2_PELHB|nr:DUF192 domain-containing protein [Pelagibacterium halotolerans]AEQ51208.1 exported protein [Pelagibacterium halotolerans B2]SEA68297.1 hypothetical protein SAMN05428936_106113 [Pelagibacterium halotolerans]